MVGDYVVRYVRDEHFQLISTPLALMAELLHYAVIPVRSSASRQHSGRFHHSLHSSGAPSRVAPPALAISTWSERCISGGDFGQHETNPDVRNTRQCVRQEPSE
jgi:hypothetical protein